MKFGRLCSIGTCGLAAAWLSGCASTSYDKADSASESLHRAALEINAENRAIDFTMASLDDLANKPAGDLKPQFERFNSALDLLVDCSHRAEAAAARANKKTAEYFNAWDKESARISYEAVRDQSASRKAQVADELGNVNRRYHENQAVVEPLISYLEDIRRALSVDLTAGGVASVRGLAENANQNAQKVQLALGRISEDYVASAGRMSTVVAQGQGERRTSNIEHRTSKAQRRRRRREAGWGR